MSVSDRFKLSQAKIVNRLIIAVPIFIIAFFITKIGFKSIWIYFSFSNQLLATFVLWTAVAYLYKHGKNFWIAGVPVIFMSASIVGYILTAKVFPFGLGHEIALYSGIATAIVAFLILVKLSFSAKTRTIQPEPESTSTTNSRQDGEDIIL